MKAYDNCTMNDIFFFCFNNILILIFHMTRLKSQNQMIILYIWHNFNVGSQNIKIKIGHSLWNEKYIRLHKFDILTRKVLYITIFYISILWKLYRKR